MKFSNLWRELRFIRHLIAFNLASAMEYRTAFISQIAGMFLNNGIYFVFWLLFFQKFGTVRGYNTREVYLLFAIVALGYGIGMICARNTGFIMAELIAQGRLDYYLVLPRNLLLHLIFSRLEVSAIGDFTFGLVAYAFTGMFHPVEIGLFLLSSLLAGMVFVGYGIITGSLAFFMGNAQQLSMQAGGATLTFALYPNTLFAGISRFLLYTLIPAAFVGAVPVNIVVGRDGQLLILLVLVVGVIWTIGTTLFYLGLRRYESGSAINVNL